DTAALFSDVSIVRGDVCNPDEFVPSLEDIKPDACVHLAWCTAPGRYLTTPENLDLLCGTLRLARKLSEIGCKRFVGVGTCFEYDTDKGLLSEDTPLRPRFPYSGAKAAAYLALRDSTPMQFAWARLFYLYGPGEHRRRLVPSVIHALLRNEPARCSVGTQVRDFLHVDDVAEALCAIL